MSTLVCGELPAWGKEAGQSASHRLWSPGPGWGHDLCSPGPGPSHLYPRFPLPDARELEQQARESGHHGFSNSWSWSSSEAAILSQFSGQSRDEP